jgi:hypothetical protein
MLHAEWIEYLKRENKSKHFEQIQKYYMPRKLRRSIQVDRKILENKEAKIIIVHSEEEFNEKCRQNPDNKKSIHYLISNQNHLLWQKSNGPTSTLNEFLIKNEECEESMDEEEIFFKNNEKALIISTEPGMGKSLILDHFTQNSSVENFFVKITLNISTKTLSDLKNQKIKTQENGVLEFVFKSLLQKKDEQEISLLKHLAQDEKLILMFDGVDEVNDYKEQVIQLIDTLIRDYRIKKCLITARNHLREELEDHFKTFSFNLNNFDDEDQKNFLVKYWRNLDENTLDEKKLRNAADNLISQIESSLTKNLNELIGIPLQTKMLADIYFEKINLQTVDLPKLDIANIAELYNQFIETKMRIQYEEKSKIEIERDQDRFEEEKEKFFSDHMKLSSSLLLFENYL